MNSIEIPIPALLEHQTPVALHPARFKVLRKGRRWGKDRLAFNVSWFGHGPEHRHPGIVDGWDVAWLAPDYPQARIIWQEEIEPRFRGVPGVELNETEHSVTISGCGALHLRSSENMTSIRGLGKRLIGVVVNEAAHLDLAYAWRQIIRPALADNHGWALIMSTTNSGTDGGTDDQGSRRVPSYFNTLCEEIRAGQRSEDWAEFAGTAEENPKIDPKEFAALVAEYPEGSIALQEEIYARLLAPGVGLAFPEWRDDRHVIDRFQVPKHWSWVAGYDWGWHQPSVFVLCVIGEEHQVVVMRERKWVKTDGRTMGADIADLCLGMGIRPEYIAADSSIAGVPARKGFGNMGEEIQLGITERWRSRGSPLAPPGILYVPKGRESRVARAGLLHRYLKCADAADGTPLVPRLRLLRECAYCVSTIPKLPPDPQRPEDVDTTADDHGYDALTYLLLTRGPLVDAPAETPLYDEDRHPGIDYNRRTSKRPWETAFDVGDGLQQLTTFEDGEPVREEPLGLMGEPLRRMGDSEWL